MRNRKYSRYDPGFGVRDPTFLIVAYTAGKYFVMSYRNLDIYQMSFKLFIETHKASLLLPKYELFELGSQLRRSSDSVVSNIVEGYGRSIYKKEYERFLVFSHSSNDETIVHLEKLILLYPDLKNNFVDLHFQYGLLGGKINNYLKWVRQNWNNDLLKPDPKNPNHESETP